MVVACDGMMWLYMHMHGQPFSVRTRVRPVKCPIPLFVQTTILHYFAIEQESRLLPLWFFAVFSGKTCMCILF